MDDFKTSGPRDTLAPGWSLLRHSLHLEDPAPVHLYLGCIHEAREATAYNKVIERTIIYNMDDYLRNTVTKYCDLARKITGQAPALRSASTPFLHEDHKGAPAAMAKDTGPFVSCPWRKHTFVCAEPPSAVDCTRAPSADGGRLVGKAVPLSALSARLGAGGDVVGKDAAK